MTNLCTSCQNPPLFCRSKQEKDLDLDRNYLSTLKRQKKMKGFYCLPYTPPPPTTHVFCKI